MNPAYLEHLDELRGRILKSASGVVAGTIVSFLFISKIFKFLCRPYLAVSPQHTLVSLDPSDTFMMTFRSAIIAGLGMALPWIVYQLWSFVAPGLHKDEKRYVTLGVISTALFFVMGALFAYFAIIPTAVSFFYSYSLSMGITPNWTIGGYFGFIMTLIACFGVVFELPVVIFLLSALGIVSPYLLTKYRRHAIVVIFIIAAIFTPPDAVTQLMMAIPMVLLYEISVLGAKIVYKKRMTRLMANEGATL